MPYARLFRCFSLVFSFALLLSGWALAQSPVDPGKLSGRTLGYLLWHGTPSREIRQTNPAFALWDDPQFAAARDSFLDSVMKDAKSQTSKPTLSREQLAQYVSLLDNPFLIGYLRRPESHGAAKSPTEKAAVAPAWNGMFFIYDRSGKEELLSKAVLQMRGAEKDIPKLTQVTVAGVAALKVERQSGITYWAEFGKYAVSANEMAVFEEILNVVNGKAAGGTLLSQSVTYQEAKPLLSGGILEFFVGLPSAEQIALSSPSSAAAQVRVLFSALKVDSVHSIAGRLSLEGNRTRISGAILGDTTPGGLFDIWADGQASPVSMGYLSAETVHYGESQFNLLGIYDTLQRAFTSAGSAQKESVSPLEQMAETRLGMPLPEALGLITGEVAWLQNSPTLDDTQKVYLLGIKNKPEALKLARSLMGDQITNERNEGDATYMKVSLRGGAEFRRAGAMEFLLLGDDAQFVVRGVKKRDVAQIRDADADGTRCGAIQETAGCAGAVPTKAERLLLFRFSESGLGGIAKEMGGRGE